LEKCQRLVKFSFLFHYESTSCIEINIKNVLANLDKATLDHRANQLNPNHAASGPGRSAQYRGKGTKADLDNRSDQMNPNSKAYATGNQQQDSIQAPAAAALNARLQETVKLVTIRFKC